MTRVHGGAAGKASWLTARSPGCIRPAAYSSSSPPRRSSRTGWTISKRNATAARKSAGAEIVCTGEHGDVDLTKAIAKSCNVYFAEAAQELGAGALSSMANKYLFNDRMLFDDIVMAGSVFDKPTGSIDTAWSAIGQYPRPRNAAARLHDRGGHRERRRNDGAQAAAVRVGRRFRGLYAVLRRRRAAYRQRHGGGADRDDDRLRQKAAQARKPPSTVTSSRARRAPPRSRRRTATRRTRGSWALIDDENHPLCIAVILERAGSGSSHAAPVAQDVLEKALDLGY